MAGAIEQSERKGLSASGKAEAILAAAKRAFLAGGFGAVSMDSIAREAAVSKATVYAHFGSKEDLFGAVIGRECEQRFAGLSAGELDPEDLRTSLLELGRRFLQLLLSPDALALHRIILGEVTRFPVLGEVFWRAGPERNLQQIQAFISSAAAAGALSLPDPGLAAEQFISLVRGEIQLRQLLRLAPEAGQREISAAVEGAVDTFIRAFSASLTTAVTAERRGRDCPAPSPLSLSNPSTTASPAAEPRHRRPGSRRPAR